MLFETHLGVKIAKKWQVTFTKLTSVFNQMFIQPLLHT